MQCKHFPDDSSENQSLEIINQLAQYLGEELLPVSLCGRTLVCSKGGKCIQGIRNNRQGSTRIDIPPTPRTLLRVAQP
ncbi:unnamed protein product [Penicillium camemberti]|uniref:Str. FM013 n=1 Tax=Penicillium camemberti (strain FM 013) TaxID=1429867 RepID=A0A0G4PS16_PENC3|nr:unnamed protein product [Penicillium camemberti]